ncbi:hypothetical protein BCR44DRAFT_38962, partial [Catenaria anguillulae PL171]
TKPHGCILGSTLDPTLDRPILPNWFGSVGEERLPGAAGGGLPPPSAPLIPSSSDSSSRIMYVGTLMLGPPALGNGNCFNPCNDADPRRPKPGAGTGADMMPTPPGLAVATAEEKLERRDRAASSLDAVLDASSGITGNVPLLDTDGVGMALDMPVMASDRLPVMAPLEVPTTGGTGTVILSALSGVDRSFVTSVPMRVNGDG